MREVLRAMSAAQSNGRVMRTQWRRKTPSIYPDIVLVEDSAPSNCVTNTKGRRGRRHATVG